MSRYIDADALLDKTVHMAKECFGVGQCYCLRTQFQKMIEDALTVDAVPVVRCGECKHRGFHRAFNCRGDEMTDYPENSKCPMQAGLLIMPDDFYCKYGERKDGESDGET